MYPASRPSSRCAHDTSFSVVSSATGVAGSSPSTISGSCASAMARARSSISTGVRPARACPINAASVSTATSDPSGERVRRATWRTPRATASANSADSDPSRRCRASAGRCPIARPSRIARDATTGTQPLRRSSSRTENPRRLAVPRHSISPVTRASNPSAALRAATAARTPASNTSSSAGTSHSRTVSARRSAASSTSSNMCTTLARPTDTAHELGSRPEDLWDQRELCATAFRPRRKYAAVTPANHTTPTTIAVRPESLKNSSTTTRAKKARAIAVDQGAHGSR